ncbi:MerR family transcriptional regulator [Enterococcus faecalis]|nr:MerR family transcriptional regulator [Enterococcus faecalis]
MYKISEVAVLLNISISTLRYYDKKGLLPFIKKDEHGYRIFNEHDLEMIQLIICLKETKMPLEKIRLFIDLEKNKKQEKFQLLTEHKKSVEQQLEIIIESLARINNKLELFAP